MIRAAVALGFAASAALLPVFAGASDTDDALKLATRVAGHGMRSARVLLHAAPAGLPSSVPLPKATLLGSVGPAASSASTRTGISFTDGGAQTQYALYYDTEHRESVVTAYEAALTAAGWKHGGNLADRFPLPQGGFAVQFPQIDVWCSPASPPAMLDVQKPRDDPSALDVSVATGEASALACSVASMTGFSSLFPTSPLPTFTASDGIAITSSGSMTQNSTTSARITSSLGLGAIFESFAKQLRDAGWSPSEPAGNAAMRGQSFRKTVDGTAYVTLLSVYALDATHYAALTDVSTK